MTKALLIIWIGFGNSQSLATEKFETLEECETVRLAMTQYYDGKIYKISPKNTECISYVFKN